MRLLASLALFVPVLLLTFAGCAEPKRDPPPDSRPFADAVRHAERDWVWIAGTQWLLGSVEGQSPLADPPELSFKPDQTWITGTTGCNRFTGSFVRRGEDGIEIGPIASTKKFCAEPAGIMQQEARILYLLETVDSYSATESTLVLFIDAEPVLIYTADKTP
ncbi:MAG: META domain-containing protein [Phycisphaerales bacterium]